MDGHVRGPENDLGEDDWVGFMGVGGPWSKRMAGDRDCYVRDRESNKGGKVRENW